MSEPTPESIARYWLALDDEKYYKADPAFDDELREKFGATLDAASRSELDHWADEATGALALIIVLDQFSRNINRGTPDMFANDARARDIANRALDTGFDQTFQTRDRIWFYLPYMHSEDLADQKRCVELCRTPGLETNLPFAIEHMEIIERFGRFPHRNDVLGRQSSDAEKQFLADGGFAG